MAATDTVAAGAAVTVAYDQPTSNALADAASNEVESFTGNDAIAAPNRPAAPVVTLTAGNEKLTAAWAAPANGGSAITGYDVEWKTASQTWAQAATAGQSDTAAADATDHEITGLTNNTAYTVRVRAGNDAGDGPWSTEASETPFSPPDAPGGLNAQAAYRQVELSWTDPDNSDIESYQYRVSDDGGNTWDPDWTEIDGSGASTTSLTLSDLDHRTEYTFGVRAVDARASGEAASVTATPAATGVAHDWGLRPPGIATGETFRLLIVTSDRRNGESGDIDDYNDHVQDAVDDDGHEAIQDYSADFRALVGTRDGASPRDNTHSNPGSDGDGEQIWWLNGPRAANDYDDFYDGDGWDHTNPVRTESGSSLTYYHDDDDSESSGDRFVWTGARANGDRAGRGHLGTTQVDLAFVGVPYFMSDPIRHGNYGRTLGSNLRLYGLSPVFRVEAPDAPYATTAAITTDPANRTDYRAGEVVKATVTFSEDVTVTGTPQLPLRIGDEERDAGYAAGDSSPTVLSFSYLVTDDDTDRDGIAIDAFALKLNGGSIKRKDTNVDAALTHTRVLADDDQRVNLRPLITDIEVTSTPQATNANDTYGLGEDIEITVTFDEAVNVTGDVDFGLSVSGAERARLKSGNGTTELVFAYTVQSGDDDANGIWIGDPGHDTIPTFDLQDSQTIVGVDSGLRADLDHDVVGPQDDHKVDGSLTAADATLSSLTLTGITLIPAFAPGTTAYTATTSLSSTTVTIAISQGQNGATGRITAPADADLNASGHQVNLAEDADTVITITVTSSNGDSMRAYTVTVTRQAATDSTAPTVSSATVSEDGATIDVVFDENLDRSGSAPAASAFEVTVDSGTAVNPDSVDFHASDDDTVVLTMSSAIAAGGTVTVAYDQPTSNALADAASNEVESFTGTDAIAALNRPAAPVVTLTAGDGKLTAAWAAPANGGSAITAYDVEWKTASQTWAEAATAGQSDTAAADATGHEITGLTNDTEYTVRVRAGNDAGDGPWSAEAPETPVSAIAQVTVEFGAASYTATEGGTAATVTVNLSADPERSVTIPITATGNGGADTSDYSLSANSVTIAGGSTSATFTVTATDDSVDDDGESVNLSFGTNLPDGVSEGTQRTATVSLTDNDGAMPVAVTAEFGAASYTAIEGRGAVTITVTLSADPERTVTIPITVTGNGGADTSDYSLSATSVTISSGDTSATFTVTATDDDVYDGDGNDETLTLGFGTPPGGVETGTQNETEVSLLDNDIEWGSDLLPDDAEIGDEFRLLFVTSGEVYPTSSDIDVYNQFVQDAAAGGHADIQDYRSLFRALASTTSVSALDNTATRYTSSNLGVPIWWLNGANVADDYRDFYDDSWDQGDPGSNETGSEVDFSPSGTCTNSALVWTGSNSDGEAQNNALGTSTPVAGLPCQTGGEIESGFVSDIFDYPLYGLSYVLQAARPEGPYVTDVGVHFEPEDSADDNGVYVTGDTIRVAVTYSEDVVVGGTGTPTFPLQIGSTTVQAAYDADKSTADQLVFTHVVVAGEVDDNGISSGGNLLTLPSTASITAADDDTEDAYLGPLNLSTELDVNSAPRILDVEVTSTPQAASDTYGLGEDIEITVTFSQAVHLEGDVLFRFNTGNGQRQARLARGNDTKALVFAYTVKSGDEDDNGIFIAHPNHNNHPTLQLETDVPGQDDQTIVGVATGLDAEIEHASPPSSSLGNHKIDATETGADATLSALSLSGITLDQTFTAGTATTSFTATTTATSATVTATASQSGGSSAVVITPADADANTTGHQVTLAEDADTVITVTVTSSNGDSMRTYTVTVTREVDTSPPSPSSARVSYDGRSIDVVFDEPLDTTRSEPPASAFDVTIDGGTAVNPTSVDFHATDADTVTLTMATPIAVQATVSVAYTDPGDATSLADQIGFKVGTFTGAMATNGIAVTAEFGAASYTAAEGGGAVTVTVTLSADPQRNVTIPIAAAGADDGDYSRSAESASFDNGATTAAFAVTAVDDRVHDGGVETLTLSFSSLPSKVTAGAQATAVVSLLDNDIPAASSLVPAGVSAGNGFRLLFVTSDTRDARSTDIDDYNTFVQNAAASGHADIQPFSSLFRALASTLSVSALDNTATNHTTAEPGVPIFWLAGPQAADDYDDFYDGGWDHRDPGRDENGAELDFVGGSNVWTGTNSDGTVQQPAAGR